MRSCQRQQQQPLQQPLRITHIKTTTHWTEKHNKMVVDLIKFYKFVLDCYTVTECFGEIDKLYTPCHCLPSVFRLSGCDGFKNSTTPHVGKHVPTQSRTSCISLSPGIVVLFSMPLVFCNCQEKVIHTCTLLSLMCRLLRIRPKIPNAWLMGNTIFPWWQITHRLSNVELIGTSKSILWAYKGKSITLTKCLQWTQRVPEYSNKNVNPIITCYCRSAHTCN